MPSLLKFIGTGRQRELGPISKKISDLICLAIAVLFLAIALGQYVDPVIALYVFLCAILTLAFLHRTGGPSRPTRMTASAAIASLLTVACCTYLLLEHDRLSQRLPVFDPLSELDLAVSAVLVALVLEATRRCIGLTLSLLVLVFLAYGFFGDLLDGPFYHRALSLTEILEHLVFTQEGLFGPALEVAAFLVFVFVMFGALFDQFGGGDFFYKLSQGLVGHRTGGSAKVAVVSSALYGSVSGSPTADVVTTGSFTIPMMVKSGYSKVKASAIEAAASTGGSILPPVMGSAAFLMSDFTGIPYSKIAVAAILPAVLYYVCVYMSVSNYASKHNLVGIRKESLPSVKETLLKHWVYLIPLGTIAWAVLALNRPSFAGALACLAVIPTMFAAKMNIACHIRALLRGLIDGVERMILVAVACAVAGLVIGTLSITDLTGKISSIMFAMAQGSYLLTVVTASVVIIVLGMGMPVPAVYALGAVLAAPALVNLGAQTMAAHLFIVYYSAISAITPPVAVAAFAAASISGSNPMAIGLQACRIGIVAFIVPLVFINNPSLLLYGEPLTIIAAFLKTLVAVLALSGVFEGYLFCRLQKPTRIALATSSLVCLTELEIWSQTACLLTIAIMLWQWKNRNHHI